MERTSDKELTQEEIDQLLAKAKQPAADAMKLHPYYEGKMQTVPKCSVWGFDAFAVWYTFWILFQLTHF